MWTQVYRLKVSGHRQRCAVSSSQNTGPEYEEANGQSRVRGVFTVRSGWLLTTRQTSAISEPVTESGRRRNPVSRGNPCGSSPPETCHRVCCHVWLFLCHYRVFILCWRYRAGPTRPEAEGEQKPLQCAGFPILIVMTVNWVISNNTATQATVTTNFPHHSHLSACS